MVNTLFFTFILTVAGIANPGFEGSTVIDVMTMDGDFFEVIVEEDGDFYHQNIYIKSEFESTVVEAVWVDNALYEVFLEDTSFYADQAIFYMEMEWGDDGPVNQTIYVEGIEINIYKGNNGWIFNFGDEMVYFTEKPGNRERDGK